jgi:hypothetical protein
MEYISHKIAFSNVIFSKDGEIDAEDQKLNFIRFRNQGTVDVVVNSDNLNFHKFSQKSFQNL